MLSIRQKYKLPGIFYLDNYPLFPPMIIISDPAVATQLTNAENLPRHGIVQDVMGELVGKHSVFWSGGKEWKDLRSTLTPGFSSTFMLGRVSRMLDHMLIFERILTQQAELQQPFPIVGKLISMTVDVIGDLMLDCQLAAQSEKEFDPIVREFRAAMKFTWKGLNFLEKYLHLPSLRYHSYKLDQLLAQAILQRYETGAFEGPDTKAGVDLFLKKYAQTHQNDKKVTLDAAFLQTCVHK